MQVRFLLPAPYDAVPKSGLRGQTANLLSRRFESGPRLQVHLRKGEKSVSITPRLKAGACGGNSASPD